MSWFKHRRSLRASVIASKKQFIDKELKWVKARLSWENLQVDEKILSHKDKQGRWYLSTFASYLHLRECGNGTTGPWVSTSLALEEAKNTPFPHWDIAQVKATSARVSFRVLLPCPDRRLLALHDLHHPVLSSISFSIFFLFLFSCPQLMISWK